jgi:hypothetical protein
MGDGRTWSLLFLIAIVVGVGVYALWQGAVLGEAGKALVRAQPIVGPPQSVVHCAYQTSFGWFIIPKGLSPAMQKQYAYGLASTTHFAGGSRKPPLNVPRC